LFCSRLGSIRADCVVARILIMSNITNLPQKLSERVKEVRQMRNLFSFSLLIAVLCVCFLSTDVAVSDEPIVKWEKTFGGAGDDMFTAVRQTADGGYICVGNTNSYGAGGDVYLVKTDSAGNKEWQQTFGGSSLDTAGDVQQTADNGYIVAGYFNLQQDACLIKTTSNGNLEWQKTFSCGGSGVDMAHYVQQTSDGGYIFVGVTRSGGAGGVDIYLVRTDSDGNEVWHKTFGGSATDEYANCVQQTADGGYIIVGDTRGSSGIDLYLIKTDSNGNEVWHKTFASGSGYTVQQTTDGGYIITGISDYLTGHDDVLLLKTDSSGNLEWDKTFGGSSVEHGQEVQQTSDGGYIVSGYTNSFGAGGYDAYLRKTDSAGNLEWDKTFGGTLFDHFTSVQQTSDGGYIAAGRTCSYGDASGDAYLVKITECPPVPPHDPWSFVQITDLHIGSDFYEEGEKCSDDVLPYLVSAVEEIKNMNPLPKFVLVSGDIADQGCSFPGQYTHYDRYREIMSSLLENGIRVYSVPGNHDRATSWTSFDKCEMDALYYYSANYYLDVNYFPLSDYSSLFDYWFERNGIIFIGLDTGWGAPTASDNLTEDQFNAIKRLGQEQMCAPKIVFLHHPSISDKQDIGKYYRFEGYRQDFIDWCDDYNVLAVLAGHTHENSILYSPGGVPHIQTSSVGKDGYIRKVLINNGQIESYDLIKVNKKNGQYYRLCSPAHLHIYDTQGRHSGFANANDYETSIPNSYCFRHYETLGENGNDVFPEQVFILDVSDDYLCEVVGTENGTYCLNISSTSDGSDTDFDATDIPTSPGARHIYAVDWDALSAGEEGVTVEIDDDGDGIFERTIIADEDLTSEEFALQTETVIDFEPDTLNLRSPGKVVTAYIELPEGFDVSDIDVSEVMLDWSVPALLSPTEIGDHDEDGIADLMVKFDRQQVIEILGPGTQMVTLTGRLSDVRLLAGIDFIRVIGTGGASATESALNSDAPQDNTAPKQKKLATTDADVVDIDVSEAFDVKEGVGFMLFEADGIINELGPESFNNEESAFELACAINDVFTMLDEGMYFEVMVILEGDILERMDGCANIGVPDEDDWITTHEGQSEVYPLILEAIELLESLIY